MARSATKSGRRPRPDAQRRQAAPQRRRGPGKGVAGRPLFFERIRRNAKWVFVMLAVVFAVSFVGLGVGSGSAGLGDLLQGNFSGLFGGGGGPSVKKALKEIEKHPSRAAGYKELADAYKAKQDEDAAIPPLERYVSMRPKDVTALQDLAVLYSGRVQRLYSYQSAVQSDTTAVQSAAALALDPTSSLGKTLSQDPISQGISTAAQTRQNTISSAVSEAQIKLVDTYKRIVQAQPDDATNVLQLAQAAQGIGDTQTAIAAYKNFLKIAPDDPNAPDMRKQLKALEHPAAAQPSVSPSSGG